MMRIQRVVRATILAGALALAAAPALAQDMVYAKVSRLDVRAGESPSARVVESVNKGTALTVLSASRFRYEVATPSGARGFVSRLQVTDSAPGGGSRGLGGLVRDDRAPEEMRSTAAGRGLTEAAENLENTEGVTAEQVDAVRQMEQRALSISDAEVEAFAKEGGLPE